VVFVIGVFTVDNNGVSLATQMDGDEIGVEDKKAPTVVELDEERTAGMFIFEICCIIVTRLKGSLAW
jgi:hypothetical protein